MSLWWIIPVAVISAALATTGIGFALARLLELRLGAFKELLGMAMVQRESIEAMIRPVAESVSDLGKTLDLMRGEIADIRAGLESQAVEIDRLKGRRLTHP